MPTPEKEIIEHNTWRNRLPPTFNGQEVGQTNDNMEATVHNNLDLGHKVAVHEDGALANTYGDPEPLILDNHDEVLDAMLDLGHEPAYNGHELPAIEDGDLVLYWYVFQKSN